MPVALAYIGVILIWSTTPLAIKWSGEGPGFLFGVTGRMVLGALLCVLLLKIFRMRFPWHRQARRTYVVAGSAAYAALMGVYWGVQYIPSGLIAVLFGLTPITSGIMAALWLEERGPTPVKFGAMLLGLAGLVIIFRSEIIPGGNGLYGVAAVLGSVLLHSLGVVWVKRISGELPALTVATGALLFALPLYMATWLVFGHTPQSVPLRAGAAIVYLAIFGSVIGFVGFYYTLKRLSVGTVALGTLITPLLALLLGHALNAEPVELSIWVGAGLISAGLIIHQWGERLLPLRHRPRAR